MDDSIMALGLMALGVWFWYESLRARETAVRLAKGLCQKRDVQLLDQTVSLSRLRPVLGPPNQWRRWYVFEYTVDGARREQGWIALRGISLAGYHLTLDEDDDSIIH